MPSFVFGAGGTSNNGASYTGASFAYSAAGSATGNLNISGSRPVSYDGISINGTYSNGYPSYSGGNAFLNRSGGGFMYFSRWQGNGGTVTDAEGYTWTNGGLQGTVTWSTVPAALGAPTATASTSIQGRIALSWSLPDNGGQAISNYRVFYETSADGSTGWSAKVEPTKTASTTRSFNADGLTPGTYYRFYVNAVNSRGTATYSTVSAVQMAPGVPGAPTGHTATRSTTVLGSVDLAWTAPSVTAPAITGYNVYATPSGGSRTKIATLGNVTTYAATGLTERLSYTFDVTARNSFADANSTESVKSGNATAVASGVPSAPTLTASVPENTDYAINLSWTVPTDTSGGLTGYNIYRTTSNSVYATTAAGTTTYSATDLVPGVAYGFFVRARNALSDAASTVGVSSNTTSTTPTGEPSAPGDITVSTISQVAGAIRFTWIPTVDTVSVNIFENTIPLTSIATVKGASYTLYGLTGGVARSYVLSTNNAFGTSTLSTPVSVTPTSGSNQTLITNVTVTNATNDAVFNGSYNLVTVGSNTFTYAKTNANIAETTVPVISGTTTFGVLSNTTNDNISATNVAITTSGPTSSSFAYTRSLTGTLGDIPPGTPVSSVIALNTTNELFNGIKIAGVPSAGTVTYTLAGSPPTVSSRVATGTVTNRSNSTYNGTYFITSATETEFTYNALTVGNTDQETSASFGAVTNLTNENMYNADSLEITGSGTYNTITYTPAPTTFNTRSYAFSATTTDGDPGSGTFRLNNGTVASATAIYIDVLDSDGTNRATWIRDWDLSASAVKGRLIIKSGAGLSVTTVFTVTGATTLSGTNDTGYFTGVVTHLSGALPTVGASTITFIPEQNATVITPYGQIRKADSTAKLDVRYRSGWLG